MTGRGFVLGKFMPPHAGHEYLCDFAQAHCEDLTILVCSLDREPIPGGLRHKWMQERYPTARVLHCEEDVPQAPEEHPDFWPIWTDLVKRYHPERVDSVFASEAYGARLAEVLGARFVPVDPERSFQPVSGTVVRAAPWKNWDRISAPARPWFTRSVCLFGPESTGKTLLAQRLAEHFSTCAVPEYGRLYTDVFGTDCSSADIVAIARGQAAAIAAARRCARGVLVTDTDPILSAVWSDMLAGQRDPWFEDRVEPADLYLLMDVDVPWVDDGTRYFPEQKTRQVFFDRCKDELEARGLRYVLVRGDWENRFKVAVAAVEHAFAEMLGG